MTASVGNIGISSVVGCSSRDGNGGGIAMKRIGIVVLVVVLVWVHV